MFVPTAAFHVASVGIFTVDAVEPLLINNNFDPNDKKLTIGHPQIGQIDLLRSFQTQDHKKIINILEQHLDVYSITTSQAHAEYDYHWMDDDFINTQVSILDILEK